MSLGVFAIAGFSAILNILALTGSLFMMEVYDRVLPSRSVPTLLGLLALVLILYVFQGFMDALRGRLLVRIGLRLDQEMSDRVYATVMRLPIQAPKRGDRSSRCATWIRSAPICPARGQRRSSICPGCRFILRSALPSISGLG